MSPSDSVIPTPPFWEHQQYSWDQKTDAISRKIKTAITAADTTPDLSWSKGTRDRRRPITIEHLAIAYFAIEQTQEHVHKIWYTYHKRGEPRYWYYEKERKRRGLSYHQLDMAFRALNRTSCHRAKAARIFAILLELHLIEKTHNHIAGNRGNVYRIVHDHDAYHILRDIPVIALDATQLPTGLSKTTALLSDVRTWMNENTLCFESPLSNDTLIELRDWLHPHPLFLAIETHPATGELIPRIVVPPAHLIKQHLHMTIQSWRIIYRHMMGGSESVAIVFTCDGIDLQCYSRSTSRNVVRRFQEALVRGEDNHPVIEIGGGVEPADLDIKSHYPDVDVSAPVITDDIFAADLAIDDTTSNTDVDEPEWLEGIGPSMQNDPTPTANEPQYIVVPPTAKEICVDGAVEATFIQSGSAFDVELVWRDKD